MQRGCAEANEKDKLESKMPRSQNRETDSGIPNDDPSSSRHPDR